MSTLSRIILLVTLIISYSSAAHSFLEQLTITTIPALEPGQPQAQFFPQKYEHKQLPFNEPGYYSLEGTVAIDPKLENVGLYIGSTAYPITVYVGGEKVYSWGNGKDSHHFVDYRSHGIDIDSGVVGRQSFRVDFWCNGESFVLPGFYFWEHTDVVNRATRVSFFNIHLLNGILVAAVLIAILFGGTFLISGRKDLEILYFALLSLTLVFALLIFPLNSQQFYEIPLFKLGRIATMFLPFFMLQFVRSYTVVWDKSRLLFWIPLGGTLLISFILIFTEPSKPAINEVFNGMGTPMLLVEFSFVLVILIRSFYTKPKSEVALITGGFLMFILLMTHDLYFLAIQVLPLFWWISYGYLLVTLSMLGALIMRQRKSYDDLLYYRVELLAANHKIEQESASRETFIQTIAHELRTPLHGMDTGLRALKDRMCSEKVDQLISSGVFTSFHRLKITLLNIFGYVAAENGNLRILSHRFILNDLFSELETHFVTLAEEKGISFSIVCGTPNMPEQFRGDREHLQLALANIMFNAVKYTSSGGVTCTINYHNDRLVCSVADTGCGLKPEMRDAFFKAFQRDEQFSFSQRYEGVGLGLSITDSIVRAMGGEIRIDSVYERGTSVVISLPMVVDFGIVQPDLSYYAVLVVDDNRVNCELLSLMVKKMGCSVALAFNGEEAVRLHKKHKYDLVLMDIQMPVMNGFEATQAIRKYDAKVPVVAVTANAQYQNCIRAGMNDHLPKPVNYDHLKEILVRLLND